MLNITDYQRNANQNTMRYPPHTSQKWPLSKKSKKINAGEDVEKRELPLLLVGM